MGLNIVKECMPIDKMWHVTKRAIAVQSWQNRKRSCTTFRYVCQEMLWMLCVVNPPLKPMNWRKEIKGVFSASISAVRFSSCGGKICSQIRFVVNFVSRKLPNPIAKIKIIIHSGGGNWCNRKKAPHKFINFRNVCKSSNKFYFRLSNLVSFRCKSTMIAEQRRTHTKWKTKIINLISKMIVLRTLDAFGEHKLVDYLTQNENIDNNFRK